LTPVVVGMVRDTEVGFVKLSSVKDGEVAEE
jgi:hypothetical protein